MESPVRIGMAIDLVVYLAKDAVAAKQPISQIKNKMTEEQIKELGWKLVKQYNSDQYHTNRYKLGCMEIEFTYKGKELLAHDLTISELNCMPISLNQAKMLSELLGHWSE